MELSSGHTGRGYGQTGQGLLCASTYSLQEEISLYMRKAPMLTAVFMRVGKLTFHHTISKSQ